MAGIIPERDTFLIPHRVRHEGSDLVFKTNKFSQAPLRGMPSDLCMTRMGSWWQNREILEMMDHISSIVSWTCLLPIYRTIM